MFLSYKSARTMFTSGMLTSCTSLSSWTCSSYENWFVLFNNALNRHTHAVVVQPFRSWLLRPQAHGSNEAYYPSAAFRSFSWLNVKKKVFFFSASGFFFSYMRADGQWNSARANSCLRLFISARFCESRTRLMLLALIKFIESPSNRRTPLHSKPREEF